MKIPNNNVRESMSQFMTQTVGRHGDYGLFLYHFPSGSIGPVSSAKVEDGKSKEGGFDVERRPLRQWVLKITEYAERLLDDLDTLDWSDNLKTMQRNWIGKSQGAKVTFLEKETKEPITVFTTRPDTLFGTTFMVISKEANE